MKKVLKTMLNTIAKALTFAGFIVVLAILFETFIYDFKGASVVKITQTIAARRGGTGFQITAPSGKRYTLTNAHICRIGPSLIAHRQDGTAQRINVIKIYKKHDLCLMEPVTGLRSLKIASNVSLHERVWLIGHPSLRPLTLESGHLAGILNVGVYSTCSDTEVKKQLEKFRKKKKIKNINDLNHLLMLSLGYCVKNFQAQYINNISYGGNSGSPVVNAFGNVVGVLFAGRRDQPTASYTVPLRDIQEFLQDK